MLPSSPDLDQNAGNLTCPIGCSPGLWVPPGIGQGRNRPGHCGDSFPGQCQIHVSATVVLSATTIEKTHCARNSNSSHQGLWPPRALKSVVDAYETHSGQIAHIVGHLKPPESLGYLAHPTQTLRVLSALGVALAPLLFCGAIH